MKLWLNEIHDVLLTLTAFPDYPGEAVVLPLLAVVFLIVMIRITTSPFGIDLNSWPRIVLVVALGLLLSLAAVVALRLYGLPLVTSPVLAVVFQVGAVLLIVAAVVVPLQAVLLKGSYLECVLNLVASIVAALLLTMLVRGAWRAVRQGADIVNLQKDRKEQVEDEIGGRLQR